MPEWKNAPTCNTAHDKLQASEHGMFGMVTVLIVEE